MFDALSMALSAAALTGTTSVRIKQDLRTLNFQTGYFLNVAVGTAAFWLVLPLLVGVPNFFLESLAIFIPSVLIGSLGARPLYFVGVERVGASVGTTLSNVNPSIARFLAILFLGEFVTPPGGITSTGECIKLRGSTVG